MILNKIQIDGTELMSHNGPVSSRADVTVSSFSPFDSLHIQYTREKRAGLRRFRTICANLAFSREDSLFLSPPQQSTTHRAALRQCVAECRFALESN